MSWIVKLGGTMFNTLVGGIIALALTAFYIAGELAGLNIEPVSFGLMLTFSAAYSGLSVKQFQVKRDSEIIIPPEVPAKDAAAAATAAPLPRVRDIRAGAGVRPAPDRDRPVDRNFRHRPEGWTGINRPAPAPAAAQTIDIEGGW